MSPHLQGKVDLILDVLDDVAFHPCVITGFKHVPETKFPFLVNLEHTERILIILKESLLLEKPVLCFSVEFIYAHLEHLQTSAPLLTKK